MTDSIIIRDAAREDIHFLAQMTYEAMLPPLGVGLFDHALELTGTDPVAFIEALIENDLNQWSTLANYLIIEKDGYICGSAGSYLPSTRDWRPLDPDKLGPVESSFNWSKSEVADFKRIFADTFGATAMPDILSLHADYIVEYVAIVPEARGNGLVGELLSAHCRRAEAMGAASVGISVVKGNTAALSAYHKFGFAAWLHLTSEECGGQLPGLDRLRLALGEN